MNRRRSFLVSLLSISVVFVSALVGRTGRTQGQQGSKGTVVFAVFGTVDQPREGTMEPILIIEQGKYKTPVAGDSDAELITRFSNEHYRSGQKYRLLSGGGEAGAVTVKKSNSDVECFRTGAEVTLQTEARLNKNVMALATNSETLGQGVKPSRRPPTDAERASVLQLARTAYKQKGVPAALLTNIETINLTATDLDRDGKFELAGSYVVSKRQGGQARYTLFLLAVPQGQSYRTALFNSERFTSDKIMSGANIDAINEGIYVERLVDQIDLDGDRVAEVVTMATGFEGVSYYIYKKSGGRWSKVYEFGNYRCAF